VRPKPFFFLFLFLLFSFLLLVFFFLCFVKETLRPIERVNQRERQNRERERERVVREVAGGSESGGPVHRDDEWRPDWKPDFRWVNGGLKASSSRAEADFRRDKSISGETRDP
jgi:hypothetical protein